MSDARNPWRDDALGEVEIARRPGRWMGRRKLDVVAFVLDETDTALSDPSRSFATSYLDPDLGFELLGGKFEQFGFTGLS